jgi:ribosomal protein S18 acetylase RimI-like enzyme
MSELKIIQADLSHNKILSKLGYDTFYETFVHLNNPDDFEAYISKAFTVEQLEKEIQEPGSMFFILYTNNTPVGYARLRNSTEVDEQFPGKKTKELQRIYVRQNIVGKSFGTLLLEHCIAEAKKSGADILWLGVWEKNDRALRFYDKHGFTKFSSHIFMMGTDVQTDILMKKDLA